MAELRDARETMKGKVGSITLSVAALGGEDKSVNCPDCFGDWQNSKTTAGQFIAGSQCYVFCCLLGSLEGKI